MCQTLIELHRPDARTLVDFGCGTGRDLEILAKRFECIGVDLQPGLVDYAHQARPGLDIRTGDMRTARLGSRMDVVTCMGNSLAYVHDNNDIGQVFATFAAHARPGALLVLCSPVAPITRTEPTTATVDTPTGSATVTIRHTWDLRAQTNTIHRHWMLPSGDEVRDEIRRRVLFPANWNATRRTPASRSWTCSTAQGKGLPAPPRTQWRDTAGDDRRDGKRHQRQRRAARESGEGRGGAHLNRGRGPSGPSPHPSRRAAGQRAWRGASCGSGAVVRRGVPRGGGWRPRRSGRPGAEPGRRGQPIAAGRRDGGREGFLRRSGRRGGDSDPRTRERGHRPCRRAPVASGNA
ncbi:methyltransferase domain-containing protein [Streptomyces sp. Tue 6430]|nr:methyltransferase domain-containing protein [Streptomyces sp. Tue 6430]